MAKILIVEDDNHLREIYELRMQAAGHDVVSAADGEEALKVAIKEKPDLVISDVMMPKISGFDMLDILRSTEETKNAKIIMMTALSQSEDKQRAENLGADRYLVKSQVTLDDVAQVTEEVLSGTSPAPTQDDSQQATQSQSTDSSATTQQTATPDPQPQPMQPAASAPVPAPAAPTQTPTTTPATPSEPAVATPPVAQTAIPSIDPTSNSPQQVPQSQPATPPSEPAAQPASDDSSITTAQSDQTQSTTPSPVQPSTPAPEPTQAPTKPPQAETTETEESAIAKQIESFMHSADAQNSTATPPEQQPTVPQTQEQPTVPSQSTEQVAAQQPETTTGEQQPSGNDDAPSKKKKVIQPLNDLTASKSDELQGLLKKEEVREEMSKVVNNLQTKDTADLTSNQSANEALKAAQEEFSKAQQQTPEQQQPTQDNQDIQISNDGSIVNQDADSTAEQPIQAAQPSVPTNNPVSIPPSAEPATQQPQQQTSEQIQPNIPHTNGTSMDGVMPQQAPGQAAQSTQAQPAQQQGPSPDDIAL